MNDAFNLHRFVDAQNTIIIDNVYSELRQGQKRTHWIWFIFPQLIGLGQSFNSIYYGIASLDEAKEYLQHPVLGQRLIECCQIVLELENHSIEAIFGNVDAMKFKSSMTLFAQAANNSHLFLEVINKYFGGELDAMTINLLNRKG